MTIQIKKRMEGMSKEDVKLIIKDLQATITVIAGTIKIMKKELERYA
jgi:hypothetical protein